MAKSQTHQQMLVLKNFSKKAAGMRKHFSDVFKSAGHESRFKWDLWDVPGQYHLLRSPATHFFPKNLIDPWMEELVLWGRKNLGCHSISPVWLSAYIDGCEQKLHVDKPHGPWAFVFSLSPKQIKFHGGNTLILKDEILDYWKPTKNQRNFEMSEIFHSIKPNFNQLLVFDGRIPHGVEAVSRAQSMNEARLVLHGWFLPPRPFIEGNRDPATVESFLDSMLSEMKNQELFNFPVSGFLCFRFFVSEKGQVSKVKLLSNTLRATGEWHKRLEFDQLDCTALISQRKFASTKSDRKGSWITLPIEIG